MHGRLLFAFVFLFAFGLQGEGNSKLYLKDGAYHIVREYQVMSDRVRYFSTERDQWEEIPVELVDIKKTETEIKQRQEAASADSKIQAEEDKAERDAEREIERVPQQPGVYMVDKEAITALKPAESKISNNKRRSVLKALSPIPLISGKAWLEVDGLHAPITEGDPRPEFYVRLSTEERFGMLRMGEHKGARVAEKVTFVPVSKEVIEEPDMVKVFRKQVGEDVYKIWPEKPLEPGEYAVVEYTEGKLNMQIWDFAYAKISN